MVGFTWNVLEKICSPVILMYSCVGTYVTAAIISREAIILTTNPSIHTCHTHVVCTHVHMCICSIARLDGRLLRSSLVLVIVILNCIASFSISMTSSFCVSSICLSYSVVFSGSIYFMWICGTGNSTWHKRTHILTQVPVTSKSVNT